MKWDYVLGKKLDINYTNKSYLLEMRKGALIYEKESYRIIGIVYEVFNNLEYGHKEKFYQEAIANELQINKIPFKRELRTKIVYKGKDLGIYILDFLVFDKIVVELKRKNNFSKKDIQQIFSYLKAMKLKLGLLINFTAQGVKIKRIINLR